MDAHYQIAHDCMIRVAGPRIEVFPDGRRPLFLTGEQWQLANEFASARTASDVYQASDAEISFDEFVALLDRWATAGLLQIGAAGAAEPGESPSVRTLLRPDIFGDPRLAAQVGARLRDGHLVVIPDALSVDLAEDVWHALDGHHSWLPFEGGMQNPGHHYRHHNVHEPAPAAVKKCVQIFDAPDSKAFMEELSGRPCGGRVAVAAAWYQPGDYGLPHSDDAVGRTVSFVWNLTKNWDDCWGGQFVWCPTGGSVFPRFNTLILFRTTPHSLHFAATVSTQAREKRMTVNGWWHDPAWVDREQRPTTARPAVVSTYGPPVSYVGGERGVIIV